MYNIIREISKNIHVMDEYKNEIIGHIKLEDLVCTRIQLNRHLVRREK